MLTMFTFDALSVCHSLSQTVTNVTLFTFRLITEEHSFTEMFKNTVYMSYFFAHLLTLQIFRCNILFPYQIIVNYFLLF